jgi:hypothetical protein
MRADRILAAAFAVIVCTAIVGFSSGSTGASFTASSTNPSSSWNTVNLLPPASQTTPVSAAAGVVDLAWTATPTAPNGHTLTYLVYRGPVGGPWSTLVCSTASLSCSDTPASDGTYQYVVQAKLAQGGGFFTSTNSATGNGLSDRTAPTMSITCNAGACGGWKNSSTVTVSGVDAGTGMGSVTYSLDGGANVNTAGSTKTINPADGTHTVAYFGTDAVGNVSGTVTQTVKIDTVAPTAATGITTAKGLSAGQINLTWVAGTDALSGVAGYTIRYVQNSACPAASVANYPSSVAVGAVTSTTVSGLTTALKYCFYLITNDNAGNASANSAVAGPQAAK